MAKSREKFDFDNFYSSLKKKNFAPVYFFYGDEDLLIEECVDAIVESAVDPAMKEFNFDILQGSEVDAKKILGIASSFPMMAERRVVVVKDFERTVKKESEEFYSAYFEKPSPTTVLVLIAANPDFRRKPYTTLKKSALCGEFRPLYDNETIAWIESRMKKLKRGIDPQAVALLHSFVGNSLRELANEIEKTLIAVGEKPVISSADIEHVVGVSREFTVFELANKVGEKNIAKALDVAGHLVNSGENAVPIIAALATHFVKLYKLHDAVRQKRPENELAQIAGVHPFFVRSYLQHLRNFKLEEIENAFLILSEADLAAKSSGDAKLILTKAITEIITGIQYQSAFA
ncbi:MAG: DNA polymerase III subunit delta [Ignavibacteriales bacterium]|nr:DNA polymerase III subunit delta [Ignavibacteriales bacterium]